MYSDEIIQNASRDIEGPSDLPNPRLRYLPRGISRKRFADLVMATCGLVATVVVAFGLVCLNPFFNSGPLFFRQDRMGLHGERFTMWKFRTMTACPSGTSARPSLAPLESERITKLGNFLRRYRLDELPNFLNVLRGDMSVIGPRPDAWDHALHYRVLVPLYKERFRVRPGITGLAQVQGGYADNANAIKRKARFDHYYVKRRSFRLEVFIAWRTICIFFSGFGAR